MLSEKQREVLGCIKKFIEEKEYSPSYIEIGKGVGVSSKSTVFKHIKSLKERGFITDIPGKKRSLCLTNLADKMGLHAVSPNNNVPFLIYDADRGTQPEESRYIPLYGYIEAGYPVEAIQIEEVIGIPEDFYLRDKGNLFALKVRGNSMIDDMIMDGDTIILKKTSEVPNGKIVAAIIDGYEATLKRYYGISGGQVKLMPSNPLFKPIILGADRVKIIGELVRLIRKY